jgi:hypothetical protein
MKHDILYGWPFVALAAGLVGLLALFGWPRPSGSASRWRDPRWLVCLMLPVYMIHQFEEHGVDLFGRRFHFLNDLCATLHHPNVADCPADPAFIFAVNVGAVWIAGALAILWRRRNIMVGACAMGIPLVNTFAHCVAAVRAGHYNSGLLTALILFVPMCAWALVQLRHADLLDARRVVWVVVSGVAVHAVLMGSLLAHGRGLLPEAPLLVINAVNGCIPFVVGSLIGAMGTSTAR